MGVVGYRFTGAMATRGYAEVESARLHDDIDSDMFGG